MRRGFRISVTTRSGRLKELNGALDEAEQLYMKAIDQMESLRGNIRLDEMRMSFGRDKYQVYENIVNLKLAKGDRERRFPFVERSKSTNADRSARKKSRNGLGHRRRRISATATDPQNS